MVVVVLGGAVDGIDGYEVRVEVDAGRGLPAFHMVGLPNTAVRESRERVMSAVRNCGFQWPRGRVLVNLAPAEVRKEGASLDLAVAVGVLGQDQGAREVAGVRDVVFLGELSLNGDVAPVRGLLAMVTAMAEGGHGRFVVPDCQTAEARLVAGVEVAGARSLHEVGAWLHGGGTPVWRRGGRPLPAGRRPRPTDGAFLGLVSPNLRRLAMTAAAGRHNLLLVGSPGSGKTRLCRAVAALGPELRTGEALEVLKIAGALGARTGRDPAVVRPARPFRAPHHTVTRAGLVGGGAGMRPGEATLAHRGILFLDELTEFSAGVLDALREPMEEGRIIVSRGVGSRLWPSDFQLLAAMNPCRCGWLGSSRRACTCPAATAARYRDRLSGPFLDRIDLFAEVDDSPTVRWSGDGEVKVWDATEARDRVVLARRIMGRAPGDAAAGTVAGGELAAARRHLDRGARELLDRAREGLALSVRSLIRCARVARTVAALDGRPVAGGSDAAQALGWRREAVLMTTGAVPVEPPPWRTKREV